MLRNWTMITVLIGVFVSACGKPAGTVVTAPNEAPSVSLADIQKDLTSAEPSDVVLNPIDPSFENINPFRTWYNYLEREEYNYLLEEASADPAYLERSLIVTIDAFSDLPKQLNRDEYVQALENVAAIDLSARYNIMPVREAQWISDMLAAQYFHFDEAAWDTFPENIKPIERRLREANYRKRTYLNYFLTREELIERWSEAEIASRVSVLLEDNRDAVDDVIAENTKDLN